MKRRALIVTGAVLAAGATGWHFRAACSWITIFGMHASVLQPK
ncbi:MAG: hypothetical protein ACRCWJ_20650 [Casimicrobium sp.]